MANQSTLLFVVFSWLIVSVEIWGMILCVTNLDTTDTAVSEDFELQRIQEKRWSSTATVILGSWAWHCAHSIISLLSFWTHLIDQFEIWASVSYQLLWSFCLCVKRSIIISETQGTMNASQHNSGNDSHIPFLVRRFPSNTLFPNFSLLVWTFEFWSSIFCTTIRSCTIFRSRTA